MKRAWLWFMDNVLPWLLMAVVLVFFSFLPGCATFDREAFVWDDAEQGWFYRDDPTVECVLMDNTGTKPYCIEYARTGSLRPRYNELKVY